MSDHGPPRTLRCRIFGCSYDSRIAIGRLFEVCSRCNRSRIVREDDQ